MQATTAAMETLEAPELKEFRVLRDILDTQVHPLPSQAPKASQEILVIQGLQDPLEPQEPPERQDAQDQPEPPDPLGPRDRQDARDRPER